MSNKKKQNWKRYCKDRIELVQNFYQAEADGFEGWCIHHRMEIWSDGTIVYRDDLKQKGLYWHRPAIELIFMKTADHMKLHNSHKHTKKHNKNISAAVQKGIASRRGKLIFAQSKSGEFKVFSNSSEFAAFVGVTKQWANRCISTGGLAKGWKIQLVSSFDDKKQGGIA